ncbi:MAG: COX15/CtaA family protein, partial [Pseudomonadales bacterium]
MTAPKPTYRLALLSTLFSFAVIMLGAFTRLADAGLGCPDWPGCYGHLLWPDTAAEVSAAEALFPDAPVEHDKTWPEMVHRYLASTLGLLAIALLIGAWRHRSVTQPLKLPLLLLGIVILQGLFGMWTVTLKLWPQVVTAHLLGGFSTAALFYLLTLRLQNSNWRGDSASMNTLRQFKPLVLFCLLVVFLQITLGGWTTSNYAAVACPDFPTCQNEWLPTMDF